MRKSYVREKLSTAAGILENKKGDLKDKLMKAYLCFHSLSEDDFPEEYRGEWRFIIHSLTKEASTTGANGEITKGRVENTLEKMNIRSCQDLAERIISLRFI